MKWVSEINSKINHLANASSQDEEHWKKRSIYKVPSLITDLNKKAYKPRAASFGPYHHGAEHLKQMEVHKQRSLFHFLRRSQEPLESIFSSLVEVAQELMDSYDSVGSVWQDNNERFVQLMIVDGCFMLEILRVAAQIVDDYAKDDPIFGYHGKLHVMPFIRRDMLLLENQLPMLVLLKLLGITDENAKEEVKFINKLILGFCNHSADNFSHTGKCLHVLDLHRKSLLHKNAVTTSLSNKERYQRPRTDSIVRSATELHEAGIRFENSRSKSLKDISFKGGFLKLPTFVVDDMTESTFLNLLAFERCHVSAGNEVTSFICFMENLIDNGRDINLLSSRGIIQNDIGSDKDAAKLFNTMSKDLTMDPDNDLNIVHCKVDLYCRKPWNRWRANLIHTYFRSPWAIISVLGAIVLFVLTTTQSLFSILQYDSFPGQAASTIAPCSCG